MVDVVDSILDSTKKKLGVGADYDIFDLDIMTHINTVFMNLHQIGIGPAQGFEIDGSDTTWDAFLGTQASPLLNSVKSYIFFKVKLAFDPPPTSFHIDSIKEQIRELEWRMMIQQEELTESSPGILIPSLPLADAEEIDGGGADFP